MEFKQITGQHAIVSVKKSVGERVLALCKMHGMTVDRFIGAALLSMCVAYDGIPPKSNGNGNGQHASEPEPSDLPSHSALQAAIRERRRVYKTGPTYKRPETDQHGNPLPVVSSIFAARILGITGKVMDRFCSAGEIKHLRLAGGKSKRYFYLHDLLVLSQRKGLPYHREVANNAVLYHPTSSS